MPASTGRVLHTISTLCPRSLRDSYRQARLPPPWLLARDLRAEATAAAPRRRAHGQDRRRDGARPGACVSRWLAAVLGGTAPERRRLRTSNGRIRDPWKTLTTALEGGTKARWRGRDHCDVDEASHRAWMARARESTLELDGAGCGSNSRMHRSN